MPETFGNELATWMDRRRIFLGLRWADVGERAGGLSTQTLREIRNGGRRPHRSTKSAIEAALEWEPGSIDAILDGGQPTESPRPVEGADGDSGRGTLDRLLDLVVQARGEFGNEVTRAVVDRGFTLPAQPPDNDRTTTDEVGKAG